jgi:hypothetical protein
MCVQFDLKVMRKRSNREERLPNFYGFWREEVHCIKDPKKRKPSCLNATISWISWNVVLSFF